MARKRVAPGVPLTEDQAATEARALIDEARRNGGDPRLLGQAQAVLAPWWSAPSPPPKLLLLRATLKQSFHDFPGALADLDVLLAVAPDDAQAWLTRATVLTVLARYDDAAASCEHLEGLVATVCRAPLLGLRGKADEAVVMLAALRPPAEQRAWVLSVQGELQRWAGRDAEALRTLQQALALDETDTYTRLLLAQGLLDAAQPAAAAQLFAGRTLNDGELLLEVLALKAAQAKGFPARRDELAARVEANRQRGETLHRREESTYALLLEGDVQRALALAVDNWAVQKEPADARVLLEAAVAAKDLKAAAPVLGWLEATGFTQPHLRQLAAKLEAR